VNRKSLHKNHVKGGVVTNPEACKKAMSPWKTVATYVEYPGRVGWEWILGEWVAVWVWSCLTCVPQLENPQENCEPTRGPYPVAYCETLQSWAPGNAVAQIALATGRSRVDHGAQWGAEGSWGSASRKDPPAADAMVALAVEDSAQAM
jgi:hypothetical protein